MNLILLVKQLNETNNLKKYKLLLLFFNKTSKFKNRDIYGKAQ